MDRSKVQYQLTPSLHRTDHTHHWELLTNFFLLATSALFLYISVAYFVTWYSGISFVSKYHTLAMLFFIPSGHLMLSLSKNFDQEQDGKLMINLGLSCLFAVVFFLFQWLAWEDKVINSSDSSPFVYFLAIAHAAYLMVTLGCSLFTIFIIGRKLSDPIQRLIFYTNGFERLKLMLLAKVWLFLNLMWAVILATFLLIS